VDGETPGGRHPEVDLAERARIRDRAGHVHPCGGTPTTAETSLSISADAGSRTRAFLSPSWAPGHTGAETLSAVVDNREEIVITRAGHEPVVIVSLDEYESLKETAYLLRNPANARRLLGSIERLESGRGTVNDLIE
ncbi:type II toxin-antitoxin system Phd/YefM family antitoxin, partial [Cryobacterium sp. TMT4-10]|uniref:type II toxin-antitoxin system Phd/YefM family antitoxin n=1 Tax=unclassified Cryobacterium TaxID=2649013 RepID=UPI003519C5E6